MRKIIRANQILICLSFLLLTINLIGSAAYAMPIIYWTDREVLQPEARIHRLVQGNVQGLVTSPVALTPAEIALDLVAGKMYWPDYSTRQINRAYLDGSYVETLYVPLPGFSLWGIALDSDNGKIYWTEPSNTNTPGFEVCCQ